MINLIDVLKTRVRSLTTCICGDFLFYDVIVKGGKKFDKYYCLSDVCKFVPVEIEVKGKFVRKEDVSGDYEKVFLERFWSEE